MRTLAMLAGMLVAVSAQATRAQQDDIEAWATLLHDCLAQSTLILRDIQRTFPEHFGETMQETLQSNREFEEFVANPEYIEWLAERGTLSRNVYETCQNASSLQELVYKTEADMELKKLLDELVDECGDGNQAACRRFAESQGLLGGQESEPDGFTEVERRRKSAECEATRFPDNCAVAVRDWKRARMCIESAIQNVTAIGMEFPGYEPSSSGYNLGTMLGVLLHIRRQKERGRDVYTARRWDELGWAKSRRVACDWKEMFAGELERLRLTRAVPEAGKIFRDCPHCPEMVVVPAGSFMMGSPSWEEGRYDTEEPRHRVTIGSSFAVGVYEVTFEEWEACQSCGDHPGWARGRRPVFNVSWDDAQSYVEWLSRETGKAYRLLSESEWEYAARAGTETRYWWGDDIGRNRANCDGCGSRWDSDRRAARAAPVGSFEANAFGLHDVHGNVLEWVQDCWNDTYAGVPNDGSARQSGNCFRRIIRGGSWGHGPELARAAMRFWGDTGARELFVGFRVARTFNPATVALPGAERREFAGIANGARDDGAGDVRGASGLRPGGRGALGASDAAADDDGYEELFGRCLGIAIEAITAAQAERSSERLGQLESEALLLQLREMHEDPAGALEDETSIFYSKFDAVSDACFLADNSAAALDAMRRGDEAALGEVKERFDKREREREEEQQRMLDLLFGQ